MLKSRLIELLANDPELLDMTTYWRPLSNMRAAQDLTGLILKVAGYHIQTNNTESGTYLGIKLPMNAPWIEQRWIDYEERLVTSGHPKIPALARQLWEAEYGEREALELPFYDRKVEGVYTNRWWDDLSDVSVYQLITFLKSGGDFALNGPYKKGG